MTPEEYEERLRHLNYLVYMFGKREENVVDGAVIRPPTKAVAKPYDLAPRH